MALMRLGPVLGNGGGAIGQMAACMAGYAHTAMEDLDSRGRGAYLYLLLGELIRHAVQQSDLNLVRWKHNSRPWPGFCRHKELGWLWRFFGLAVL